MIALDTNVIARYLLRDDPAQFRQAAETIEAAVDGDGCFLPLVVLCELVWVLRSCVKADRHEIAQTIGDLLLTGGMTIESADIAHTALQKYSRGKGDFADYIIGATADAHDAESTVTFDRKLAGEMGFMLLE